MAPDDGPYEKVGTNYGVGRAFPVHLRVLAGPLKGSLPVARCPGIRTTGTPVHHSRRMIGRVNLLGPPVP
jgi:hypothetical protein